MKARNRLFAILLALAMVVTYMPGLAYATEAQPAEEPLVEQGAGGADEDTDAPNEEAGENDGQEEAGEETPAAPEAKPEAEPEEMPASAPSAEQEEPANAEDPKKVDGVELEGEGKISVPKAKLAGGDDLLMNFLEDTAKGELDGDSGDEPEEAENPDDMIYDALYDLIWDIARGHEDTPIIEIDPSELTGNSFEYTAEDLNLTTIFEGEGENLKISDIAAQNAMEAYENDFSYESNKVINKLLRNVPFEFYWYDKTKGYYESTDFEFSAEETEDSEVITVMPTITFVFSVSVDYRDGEDIESYPAGDDVIVLYRTDEDKTSDAYSAASTAGRIVREARGLNNYDRLWRYKDAICEMTSYNDEAASDDYDGGYGDPWQLIYVFDEDDETEVVCEGYSKAFQFLCDLTEPFVDVIDCESVTGTMSIDTEEEPQQGPHMWNVVSMDGNNYLADITNCDSGTIGDPDQLFLAGWSAELNAEDSDEVIGYRYTCENEGVASNVDYVFDDDMFMEMSGAPYVDLAECEIFFDNAEIFNDQVPFYTVDVNGENASVDINDLDITVRDHRGRVADDEGYDLSFTYYVYGETPEQDTEVPLNEPFVFGIQAVDADYGMTEYHVIATANGEGACKGKTGETFFYVRDKHSLQWFGAVINFANGLKDSWRMRDRFWIQSGHMTAPTVNTADGVALIANDYTINYYRTEGDPTEDSQNKSWEDYIVADGDHKLDSMPTEPGHYFVKVVGNDAYYGLAITLFDIVDYAPFAVDYGYDALWSDGTKTLTLHVPNNINGVLKVSGAAVTDYGDTRDEISLDDNYYEYDAENGELTLDGEKIFGEIGYDCWLDLNIDIVDTTNNNTILARGRAAFELNESRYDYGFEENRDMMPGWDGSVRERKGFYIRNQDHPEGYEGEYSITSVEVLSGVELLDTYAYEIVKPGEDEAGEKDRYFLLSDDEGGYYYSIKEWTEDFVYDDPVVTLQINYRDVDGIEKSYTIDLTVKEELYEIHLGSDDNRNTGLPGDSFDLTAWAQHKYYDDNGEYHEDTDDLAYKWYYAIASELDSAGKGYNGSDDWTPEWEELPANGLDVDENGFVNFSVINGNKANLQFVKLKENLDADAIYVRVDLEDNRVDLEDNNESVSSDWGAYFCRNEYVTIEPSNIRDLEYSEETGYQTFEVRRYSIDAEPNDEGEKYSVIDADFIWHFDDDEVAITEPNNEEDESEGDAEGIPVEDGCKTQGNIFNIERVGYNGTELRLEAEWIEKDDNGREIPQREEKVYRLGEKDYNLWFDNETNDIYTDGDHSYTMEGNIFDDENWSSKYDIQFEAGIGDWQYDKELDENVFVWSEEFEENREYSISNNGKTVTIHGNKLTDLVDEEFVIRVNLVLKSSGEVVGSAEKTCCVKEPREEFRCDTERNILPGWDGQINRDFQIYYENTEYPYGFNKNCRVTKVIPKADVSEYLSNFEEKDDGFGWYYRAKDRGKGKTGSIEFTVTYIDLAEDVPEGGSPEEYTYTYTLNIVDDVYDVNFHSEGSRYNGLPGDIFELSADGRHEFFDENGNQVNNLDGYHFEWEITHGEKFAEISVNENDSSKATLAFKNEEALDDILDEDWQEFLDEEIDVRVNLVKDEEENQSNGVVGFFANLLGLGDDGIVASKEEDFWLHSWYAEIYPLGLEDLGLGQSLQTSFTIREYSINNGNTSAGEGYIEKTPVSYSFDFDQNAFEITYLSAGDEDSEPVVTNVSSWEEIYNKDIVHREDGDFIFTRKGDWDTDIRVFAYWERDDGWTDRREQNYRFDRIDNNIEFNRHDVNLFTDIYTYLADNPDPDIEYQHVLNIGDVLGDDWADYYNCDLGLTYKGSQLSQETGDYTVEYDKNGNMIITLTESFMDAVASSEDNHADVNIQARLFTADADPEQDPELSQCDAWFHVDVPVINYHDRQNSEDILPNDGGSIERFNRVFVRDTAHPRGEDLNYEVTQVEVTEGIEYLVEDVYEHIGEGYFLNVDEKDPDKWSYRVKDPQGIQEAQEDSGTAPKITFVVTYEDYETTYGEGDERPTYTFTRNIVNERYYTWIENINGCDTGAPGASFGLVAVGWKDYIGDSGETLHTGEGFTFDYDIVEGDDYATLTPEDDGPYATLTFNNDPELDNKRVRVRVKAFWNGSEDPVAENDREFWIRSDHTEMFVRFDNEDEWVTNKTPDLMPGESTTAQFQLRQYDSEASGDGVHNDNFGSYRVINAAYRWEFNADEAEIRPVTYDNVGEPFVGEPLESGAEIAAGVDTFKITKKVAYQINLRLKTDYGDENDPFDYEVRFGGYNADISHSDVVFKDSNGNTIEPVEEEIPTTPHPDFFYKVHIGTTAAPELTIDGKPVDSNYFKARYSEVELVNDGSEWNLVEDNWSDTFPTAPGVYLCEIDGLEPFHGIRTYLDFIKVEDHVPEKTEAKEATCGEPGNIEYWTCSVCGKFFSDEECTNEIKENSWLTPIDAAAHNLTHHPGVEATCTEDGTIEYWSCSICEKNYSDAAGTTEATSLVDPKKDHDMTHHAAVAATCEADGTIEYWHCSTCNKNYSDAAGTTEVTDIAEPKLSHDMTHHDAVAATCEAAGTIEHYSCSICEKNYSDETGTTEISDIAVPKLSHDMTHHDAVAATCEAAGTIEYWHCSTCNKNYSDAAGTTVATSLVDQKKDHVMTHHDAKPASCTEDGTIEYWSCSTCNKNYSDAAGTTEVTDIVDGLKTGHEFPLTHYDADPVECTVEHWHCNKCNMDFSDENAENKIESIRDNDLYNAKKAANDELDKVNLNNYSGAERTNVENAVNTARAAIRTAATVDEVNSAKNTATSTINAQKTNAQKEAAKPKTKPERVDLKAVKGLKVKGAKGKLTVKWKKATKKELKTFQGYEIQYTLNGTFTDYPAKKVGKKKASVTLKKLLKKKKYTVRIRRYRDDGSVLHVSNWKVKKAKTK